MLWKTTQKALGPEARNGASENNAGIVVDFFVLLFFTRRGNTNMANGSNAHAINLVIAHSTSDFFGITFDFFFLNHLQMMDAP